HLASSGARPEPTKPRCHRGRVASVKRIIVTGSSGLIGSEAVAFFDQLGWDVHGVDNNMRRSFFGPDGDTTWNLERLRRETRHFTHHELDIRDGDAIPSLFQRHRPEIGRASCRERV